MEISSRTNTASHSIQKAQRVHMETAADITILVHDVTTNTQFTDHANSLSEAEVVIG